MERLEPLQVIFYTTVAGHEPVREWLRSLDKHEKKLIGEDIKTVQFGWPLGMPLTEKLDRNLWEIRTKLRSKISRVMFTVHENQVVLVHGFIKKSRKIPIEDMELAQRRRDEIKRG